MLSPLAQLTVINGNVERDDLYHFQVCGAAGARTIGTHVLHTQLASLLAMPADVACT